MVVRTQWLAATQRVRLSVLDHGHGFADAILRRAFEPYVTTKAKGTGLGLAIVRKIVEEHGGSIEADNRAEGGARIRIVLPMNDRKAASARADVRKFEPRRERA
mgnify:CR=1 FL=1